MATAVDDAETRPDVVATWSAPLELQPTSTEDYGCDNSHDPINCWSAVNSYLNCGEAVSNHAPGEDCIDDRFADASPITHYDYTSTGPPTFFANGGGGTSAPELIDIQEAKDFEQGFVTESNLDYVFCQVDLPEHATDYLDKHCDAGDTEATVLQRTVDFLAAYL